MPLVSETQNPKRNKFEKYASLNFSLSIKRFVHVDHFESALECCDHLFAVLLVELFDRVVARNYNVSVQ